MRSFFYAIGLVVLTAASSAAQLLDARPAAKPAEKPVPGQPAAEAKRGDNPPRPPGAGAATAPQPNAMFAVIDADGDGVISKVELRKAIKALKSLDTDDDGSITLAEASVGDAPIGPGVPGRPNAFGPDAAGQGSNAVALVMRYDVNNDQKLSVDEAPPGIARMFRAEDDLNGNGAMDPAELQAIMARMGDGARAWAAGPEQGNQRTPFRDPNRRRPRPDDQNR